jgi:hypothetical protein
MSSSAKKAAKNATSPAPKASASKEPRKLDEYEMMMRGMQKFKLSRDPNSGFNFNSSHPYFYWTFTHLNIRYTHI